MLRLFKFTLKEYQIIQVLVTVGLENSSELKINHILNYPVYITFKMLYFKLGLATASQ
jgi:hypothetical protein